MKDGIIVTIDGPSAAGKSSVARLLARRLGFLYLDSGALYRAIGWKALKEGISIEDNEGIERICKKIRIDIRKMGDEFRIMVDHMDITEEIRGPEVSRMASEISALPTVRKGLLELQQDIGRKGNVVIEGRDTGTVVFPGADIKFYLDADIKVRGERRWKELRSSGFDVDLNLTIREIEERDRKDKTRTIAPLMVPSDAVLINNTDKTLSDVADLMLKEIKNRIDCS
ncbi:MAG: (d)CMP kinase [Nitrospirota bacterium]